MVKKIWDISILNDYIPFIIGFSFIILCIYLYDKYSHKGDNNEK